MHALRVARHPIGRLLRADQHIVRSEFHRGAIDRQRYRFSRPQRQHDLLVDRRERLRNRPQRLAVLRPQRLQVRLVGVLDEIVEIVDCRDPLHVQFLGNHFGKQQHRVPLLGRAARKPQFPQWLPNPLVRLLTQSVANIHNQLRQCHPP